MLCTLLVCVLHASFFLQYRVVQEQVHEDHVFRLLLGETGQRDNKTQDAEVNIPDTAHAMVAQAG